MLHRHSSECILEEICNLEEDLGKYGQRGRGEEGRVGGGGRTLSSWLSLTAIFPVSHSQYHPSSTHFHHHHAPAEAPTPARGKQ